MHSLKAEKAVDYGPPATMRVCVLQTGDVPVQRSGKLLNAVNQEFAPYGITVEVAWVKPWIRPGFQVDSIMDDVKRRDLEPPCDRLMALVDRNVGDFLWGLAMPEVLGAVDGVTATRGYVVATGASLNQLFLPPSAATVHEFYHLLGCPHGLSLANCYPRIAAMKAAIDPEADFFPGVTKEGKFLTTREAANSTMRAWIAEYDAKRSSKDANTAPGLVGAGPKPPDSKSPSTTDAGGAASR